MEVRLLGGLDVLGDDGESISVPGAKLRGLLALLALDAGRVISTDQLIDALWGDEGPADVANALQRLVSKLRRTLPSPDAIVTRAPGYLLALDPDAVDVHRVDRIVSDARNERDAGRAASTVELLREAEALWRGEPLADFRYDDFARPHISRLDELHAAIVEERIDAELALGRHAQLLAELEVLVDRYALRERLRGQLMLALYRTGRQADALRVFQDGRAVLGEELGLDPGPELRALEAAILDQSDELLFVGSSASERPPAGTARRTNVKAALTPLVGRASELAEVAAMLAERRLVTLVGPGGAGKTRLATELARVLLERFADGTFVAELAPIGEGDDVPRAVVAAFDLPDSDADAASRLRQHCRDAELLLVLDNCEHLLDAAATLADDLLSRCPGVRIVATSREGLRVGGEVVWPVPPLPPDDSIELFAQRARAADPAFSLDDDARAIVADVSARLDGLPLAIELAAARTRAFPLDQLRDGLSDRFRLLTSGTRTSLPRHQTLRAVVDWSYDLLFDDERRVFERLSVFPGACVLDAARAVCADDDLGSDEVGELLASLVDKSLLTVDRSSRPARYAMLQTLTEYGRNRLLERGDPDDVLRRMARYYAELSDRGTAAQRGVNQRAWLLTIGDEYENLRAALDWSMGAGDRELALRIASGTAWHRWVSGTAAEGCRALDEAMAISPPSSAPPLVEAAALRWRAYLGLLVEGSADVDTLFDQAVALEREFGGHGEASLTLALHAQVAVEQGRHGLAVELIEAALAVIASAPEQSWSKPAATWLRAMRAAFRDGDYVAFENEARAAIGEYLAAGDEFMTAISRGVAAEFDERRGDYDRAAEQLEQALVFMTDVGVGGYRAFLLARLALVHLCAGNLDRADALFTESMRLADELAFAPVRAVSLNGIANVRRRQGRLEEAERAATGALTLYRGSVRSASAATDRDLGYEVPAGAAASLAVLGFVAEARHDAAGARDAHRRGLEQALITADARSIALALEGLAATVALADGGILGAQLLGAAAALRDERAVPGPSEQVDIDRACEAVRALLDNDAWEVAFADGRGAELGLVIAELDAG